MQRFSALRFFSGLHLHSCVLLAGGFNGGAAVSTVGDIVDVIVLGARCPMRWRTGAESAANVSDGVRSALVSNSLGDGTRISSLGQAGEYALGKRCGNCGSGARVADGIGVGVDGSSPGKLAATGCGTITGTGLSSRGVFARGAEPIGCRSSGLSRPALARSEASACPG